MASSSTAQFDQLIKLLTLGASTVGKTSLIARFSSGEFKTDTVTTIGIDFKQKEIEQDGQRLRLQIWDTAGQERFRTLTPAYYQRAQGVIFVYDVTNAETFNEVNYWLDEQQRHGEQAVERILVGNKADLVEERGRAVSREEGEQLAKRHKMRFLETSAKTGVNVDEAFNTLSKAVVQKRLAPPEESIKLDSTSSGQAQRERRGCCGGGTGASANAGTS